MIVLVLSWWSYPFIMLAVAVPMALFYVIERRRELREERNAPASPCMTHTGTDTDGTELWCWQKYGHSGTHDDYASDDDGDWIRAVAKANGYTAGLCRIGLGVDSSCVKALGHPGECSDF